MAWSASAYFRQTMADNHKNTVVINLDAETHKCALYTAGTPDKDVTAALSAYNAATSQWVTANEASGTGYTAGGAVLANTTVTTPSTGVVMWDADDLSWTTVTLTSVVGTLIYADALTVPVADQGLAYVYFGGAFSVTAGTFTIQWATNGILRVTV